MVAVEKHQVITPRVTAMPAEPISSSGLRPILSMTAMAARHATIDNAPDRMLIFRLSSSVKPTDCHSTEP